MCVYTHTISIELLILFFQCKQTFENILCVQTTALLKKSALEKIYKVLQESMCKINGSIPGTEVIHYEDHLEKMYAIQRNNPFLSELLCLF